MSSITNDLARYRRRVTLAQAPQQPSIPASAEQRKLVLESLAKGNPNGYVDFSLVTARVNPEGK